MKLKRIPSYEIESIVKTGAIEAYAFRELQEAPDGLEAVRRWRSGTEKLLQGFDQEWIVLCEGDVQELTEWASRMASIRRHLDEMDRHLGVAGTRLFQWDKVLNSMGYVNASRVAIEQMLGFNKADVAA